LCRDKAGSGQFEDSTSRDARHVFSSHYMLRIEIALAWKRTLAREGVDANRATPA